MINSGIIRTTENASSAQNSIKSAVSEQKLPRMKARALGDVQNTLHSRPPGFVNPNTNSAVRAPNKSSNHLKTDSYENYLSAKSASEKNIVTPFKSATKSLLATPIIDGELFETHNHKLCEEDEQTYLNVMFSEYKFSQEEIKNLVRSFKVSSSPLSVPFYEPCEDIELPNVKSCQENNFSICDIFSDMVLPEVPPLQ